MLGEENPDLLSSMGRTRPEHALTLFILGEHLKGAAAADYQDRILRQRRGEILHIPQRSSM